MAEVVPDFRSEARRNSAAVAPVSLSQTATSIGLRPPAFSLASQQFVTWGCRFVPGGGWSVRMGVRFGLCEGGWKTGDASGAGLHSPSR